MQHGDAPVDDPIGLEALDALPARGLRQADPLADGGDGERGVVLQQPEDLQIDRIQGGLVSVPGSAQRADDEEAGQ